MSLKDHVLNKKHIDEEEETTRKRAKSAYHGYFEGYSEVITLKENKRGATRRFVYTGDYYSPVLSARQRIAVRVEYLALLSLSTLLFLLLGLLPGERNSSWYIAFPQAVSIPFLFWAFLSWCHYLPNRERLTIVQYNDSSVHIRRTALGAAVCFGCSALSVVVYVFLHLSQNHFWDLISILGYLIAGCAMYGLYAKESVVQYIKTPSSNESVTDKKESE